jgi:hypothetical protein
VFFRDGQPLGGFFDLSGHTAVSDVLVVNAAIRLMVLDLDILAREVNP